MSKFQLKTTFQDGFSEEIWRSTYKDHADEDVNSMFKRTANAVASVEATEELRQEWAEKFYEMLTDFKVVVGGRIMANAGTEWQGTTLMNCFVGPRAKHDVDSIESIMFHLESQAQTLKSEGGWGENFSYLRPRGAFINGIGVESPGAVKYMELFDKSSEIITSGSGKKSDVKKAKGKIRKGAQMGVLDIWHPDIVEFITAKQQQGRLTKFNVSVNASDLFMKYLQEPINKIVIELNDGSIHYLDPSEELEIDGKIMTALEYKSEFQVKTNKE
jgi:ribonucleoside-diphosphate reductase alpha chain